VEVDFSTKVRRLIVLLTQFVLCLRILILESSKMLIYQKHNASCAADNSARLSHTSQLAPNLLASFSRRACARSFRPQRIYRV
jgi:hypothetical protein